jgi:hypothetical protein
MPEVAPDGSIVTTHPAGLDFRYRLKSAITGTSPGPAEATRLPRGFRAWTPTRAESVVCDSRVPRRDRQISDSVNPSPSMRREGRLPVSSNMRTLWGSRVTRLPDDERCGRPQSSESRCRHRNCRLRRSAKGRSMAATRRQQPAEHRLPKCRRREQRSVTDLLRKNRNITANSSRSCLC